MAIERPSRRIAPWAGMLVLGVLAAYGLISSPGLAMRWGVVPMALVPFMLWCALACLVLEAGVRSPGRMLLLAFGVIALALRFAVTVLAVGRVPGGDAFFYPVLAHNLIAGQGLVMVEPFMGVATRALYPPIYPLLLAGWGTVAGLSPVSYAALNTVIDVATGAAIVWLATLLDRRREGVAAAMLYFVWPSTLLSVPIAAKEGLVNLLVVGLAIAWILALRPGRGWRGPVALGLIAGLLALTQPETVMLAVLFGVALGVRSGLSRMMAVGLRGAGIAALVMMPWWLRNLWVLGAFVPLTTSSGYSLWIGNNPDATGNWVAPPAALRGLPEIAFGHAAAALAWDWIVHHPAGFARLTVTKFLRAGGIADAGILRLTTMRPAPALWVGALLFPVAQGAHMLLLAGGATALGVRRNPALATIALLLAAGIAQLLLFGVWFEFGQRHCEFLTPLLLIAATVAYSHVRKRSSGSEEFQLFAPARQPG